MKAIDIKSLLNGSNVGQDVKAQGWVRTFRSNRFININDGSTIHSIQAVIDFENINPELLKRITTGASIMVEGTLVESQGKGQAVEIAVKKIEIIGDSESDVTKPGIKSEDIYPLQPKNHSLEYLREIAHLRFRTSTFGAVFRIRHAMTFAMHKFFNDRGFFNIHTPIITASDAEGAGEMFRVTTLPLKNLPLKSINSTEVDWSVFDPIATKYAQTVWDYVQRQADKTPIKEIFLVIWDSFDKFQKNMLMPPERLESNSAEIKNDNQNLDPNLQKFLLTEFNPLFEFFRDGRMDPNFGQKELVAEVKAICKKNGLKIVNQSGNNLYRFYPPNEVTFLSLCFFNIFKIEKIDDIDFEQDFFGRETNLTVSGQLEAELAALALSKVYTFGPTFRAENSNTARHLAEFWMIEPEVAFADLTDNMNLAEANLKYLIQYALDNCAEDLAFLNQRLLDEEKNKKKEERSEMSLIEKLNFVVSNDFERLTYSEAIDILQKSKPAKEKKFQYEVKGFGTDLQSEHERYLVEKHFKKPVILTDYPKEIKSFYMRQNDDGTTVRAMDILFPGIGEIVGGSQREERHDKLLQRMNEMNIPAKELWWYLDTRKFGTVPHAGYGLGFERLLLFVTGMTNVRDVSVFPRTPKSAEF